MHSCSILAVTNHLQQALPDRLRCIIRYKPGDFFPLSLPLTSFRSWNKNNTVVNGSCPLCEEQRRGTICLLRVTSHKPAARILEVTGLPRELSLAPCAVKSGSVNGLVVPGSSKQSILFDVSLWYQPFAHLCFIFLNIYVFWRLIVQDFFYESIFNVSLRLADGRDYVSHKTT